MSNKFFTLKINYPKKSSRSLALAGILIFPKMIILIPLFLLLTVFGWLVGIFSWVGQVTVLISGNYPKSIFNFLSGYLQFDVRVKSFLFGLSDFYPPISLEVSEDPESTDPESESVNEKKDIQ